MRFLGVGVVWLPVSFNHLKLCVRSVKQATVEVSCVEMLASSCGGFIGYGFCRDN